MGVYLKITAGLILLVQVFHLASLQSSAAPPRWTIDKGWLRLNSAAETKAEEGTDESGNDLSSGIASGSMAVFSEEEENVAGPDKSAKETSDDLTAVTTTMTPTNVTTKEPELPDATISPTNETIDRTNSSQSNNKEAKEEVNNSTMTPQNSTTHLSAQNSTDFPEKTNHTDAQTPTLAPESNATQESTTKPDKDTGLTKATESTKTTTVTTTPKQEVNKTSTTSSSTTALPSETAETTTTAAYPITAEKANKTNKTGAAASGSSSERGLATDTKSKRNGAWGAVLGTAVAVALVGLVAYIIMKKHQKGFSHRKLVEEYPTDSVHRLENGDPLDLNFGVGGSAYYNPGLQGDSIQMNNFPGRR
ncbi:mucin-15 [Centropristis striata]|uniref:mucin-15 n=1 Tax=Centropristis striata TaxID=184440 RepID=UPI0027DF346D|nr:mucin-15 [Centropristis striata]XP_059202230.1 mucin-15 [Centropristis striata]XP_059202240.1 mucin-15 [Centropristis striata]XP_059202248.1 mucin-15 [Centropristis striata]XP_059202256.1 mucin-15 [Centropristis striata]